MSVIDKKSSSGHPKVTIFLSEQIRDKLCDTCREPTTQERDRDFLGTRIRRLRPEHPVAGISHVRKVKLAGREGLETFVEIVRPDNPKSA